MVYGAASGVPLVKRPGSWARLGERGLAAELSHLAELYSGTDADFRPTLKVLSVQSRCDLTARRHRAPRPVSVLARRGHPVFRRCGRTTGPEYDEDLALERFNWICKHPADWSRLKRFGTAARPGEGSSTPAPTGRFPRSANGFDEDHERRGGAHILNQPVLGRAAL